MHSQGMQNSWMCALLLCVCMSFHEFVAFSMFVWDKQSVSLRLGIYSTNRNFTTLMMDIRLIKNLLLVNYVL